MAEAAILEELNEMLEQRAQGVGSFEDDIIREAILRHFDDLEDIRTATERLLIFAPRISLKELKRKCGPED